MQKLQLMNKQNKDVSSLCIPSTSLPKRGEESVCNGKRIRSSGETGGGNFIYLAAAARRVSERSECEAAWCGGVRGGRRERGMFKVRSRTAMTMTREASAAEREE